MWSNQKSLKVVVRQALGYKPPYCPNPACKWHMPEIASKEAVFHGFGSRPIKRYPYLSPRFRCTNCRKVFTRSFFFITYRDRTPDTYEEIFDMRFAGSSKLHIARFLGCSRDTVQRRIRKMARWSYLRIARDTAKCKLPEPIAFDGIENFSFSQYDPNNINHAVGKESLYIYDFNLSPLNRKGRMSERQKERKRGLEKIHGKYDPNSLRKHSERLFRRLLKKSGEAPLVLHTDYHYAYREALRNIGKGVVHYVTPSKVARNYKNRLFAINHTDMLTRHHLADFKRETIAFAKDPISMLESFAIFAAHKNYMRPRFLKRHARDERAHLESPAMRLGFTNRILSFREFFQGRITKAQANLNEDWLSYFERRDESSRRLIRAYNGI